MRWLLAGAYVAAATLAATALVHCSSTTELIVVVDTDFRIGDEVDEILVKVDDGAGFDNLRSARIDGPGATTMPLTLGVAAGGDPNAKLGVQAIARLRGSFVGSATLRTSLVEGESKMGHVSICRACARAECDTAEIAGSALPSWSGSPPSAPSCATPIATDGGDAGAVDAGDGSIADGGDASDSGDAGPPLLAWWDFEEAAGTVVFDKSGNGRDVGFSGSTVKRGPGKNGNGLVFSRTDAGTGTGTLDCTNFVGALVGSSGTLSFWWRDDDDAPASTIPSSVGLFSTQSSGRDHFFFSRFRADPAQTLTLGFQFEDLDATSVDDYANGDGGTKLTVVKGAWTQLVVTWTANAATLRVGKGATAMSLPFYRPWAPTKQNCFFGSHALGALDDVRFYARPLTDAEIADLP